MMQKKTILSLAVCALLSLLLCGCGEKTELHILSGSENQELERILEDCEKETGVQIQMTYKGSVDIMRSLQAGGEGYDAVWPASSMWISLEMKPIR